MLAVSFDRFPRAIRECLAGFEALLRLQFKAEDIHFHYNGRDVGICVHTKGKEYSIRCGRLPADVDPEKVWQEACDAWTAETTSETDRLALYHGSLVLQHGVELVFSLRDRGMLDHLVGSGGSALLN